MVDLQHDPIRSVRASSIADVDRTNLADALTALVTPNPHKLNAAMEKQIATDRPSTSG